jgi:hypothetical protein
VRAGYIEQPPDAEGWRDPPPPLDITARDPRLDERQMPSVVWALGRTRGFLSGELSVDQLYRDAYELASVHSAKLDTSPQSELDGDLMFQFVDALRGMTLTAILRDDETVLKHYLAQWARHLERGEQAWRATIARGVAPAFEDLDSI